MATTTLAPRRTPSEACRIGRNISILNQHSVPIRWMDGELEALDRVIDNMHRDVSKWVAVTDWSEARLYAWMGY